MTTERTKVGETYRGMWEKEKRFWLNELLDRYLHYLNLPFILIGYFETDVLPLETKSWKTTTKLRMLNSWTRNAAIFNTDTQSFQRSSKAKMNCGTPWRNCLNLDQESWNLTGVFTKIILRSARARKRESRQVFPIGKFPKCVYHAFAFICHFQALRQFLSVHLHLHS